ncbi:hypothetical protein PENSPDRAFT_187072 [Peniophora sp. CONT]|nr:hypothetical protein PENSPDRAFT_187072 [Peniophora sp. CONT]
MASCPTAECEPQRALLLATMYCLWTPAVVLCILIIPLILLSKVQRVRGAFVALITYLATISPPASLYLCVLDLDALTTRYHRLISEASTLRQGRITILTRATHALEARHQSELVHLHRSISHLKDLLDESHDRETRQKRRVQRKVGQERKLSVALGEQLTIAHASNAQARRRVFDMSQVCGRVQGSNARLRAENDELRAVGGEVLDDNERLFAELHLALRETARYREEISCLEGVCSSQFEHTHGVADSDLGA